MFCKALWSYPLPRDIIARTICKIGESALEALNSIVVNGDNQQISEATDAIGFISFYCNNKTSFETLEKTFQNCSDEVIQWKIIRALSAFENSKHLLLNILKTSNKSELKWEAIRSLGLICKEVPQELLSAKNDKNKEVKKMAFLAIDKIRQ